MEMEKRQTSSWLIVCVVVHLDRLDDLENDESRSISSPIRFLDAARLRPLTLLLALACCTYVSGC